MEYLGSCIKMLKAQNLQRVKNYEILVIDSSSTDQTIQIAKSEECTLIVIPKKDFNYGGTLNKGISCLDKELIIAISAHAIPVDCDLFTSLITPFDNPNTAGTYIKQIPWPDAPFLEKIRIRKTFGDMMQIFTETNDKNMHFSNVASCFRKELWERHPFHTLPSTEDYFWAKAMLDNHYSIQYLVDSKVYHSHSDSCLTFAERIYTIQRNKMVLANATPFKETIMTLRAALSHIKNTSIMCIIETGNTREKLIAFIRSFIESYLLIKQHYNYVLSKNGASGYRVGNQKK